MNIINRAITFISDSRSNPNRRNRRIISAFQIRRRFRANSRGWNQRIRIGSSGVGGVSLQMSDLFDLFAVKRNQSFC